MMNKYDLFLFMLKHKHNKVCDFRPRSCVQALFMEFDEEKFNFPEKYWPNLLILSKVLFHGELQWMLHKYVHHALMGCT